jgi:uncharacterized membrane protein YedE/YeeE
MEVMMWRAIAGPWPWYVGGPLIGLFVPVLLILGNKQLGLSGSLRAICAAVAPTRVEFFRYDWKGSGLWNIALGAGLLVGAALAVGLTGVSTPAVSPATHEALAKLGLNSVSGLVPSEIFSWRSLLTFRGATCMVTGGFLVGFGASYAGGCTSGHGVMGLAARQVASLIAICGIFAGGLLATFVLLPAIL